MWNDEIALQHFFFLLAAVQEFFSISFVLHAIFFFRQGLAENFFSKSSTPPPLPQELNGRPLNSKLLTPRYKTEKLKSRIVSQMIDLQEFSHPKQQVDCTKHASDNKLYCLLSITAYNIFGIGPILTI